MFVGIAVIVIIFLSFIFLLSNIRLDKILDGPPENEKQIVHQ